MVAEKTANASTLSSKQTVTAELWATIQNNWSKIFKNQKKVASSDSRSDMLK